MEVVEAIRLKRAVREFDPRPLPDEVLQRILWAGGRAQSSKNTQPWHFIAIRDRSTLEALSRLGTYAGHLAGAALGVAIVTPDPASRFSILFDAGPAAAYMPPGPPPPPRPEAADRTSAPYTTSAGRNPPDGGHSMRQPRPFVLALILLTLTALGGARSPFLQPTPTPRSEE